MAIAENKKAYHDYHIIQEYEAGLELMGPEVKSLRDKKADISHSYVKMESTEAFLVNAHISPYKNTSFVEYDPKRKRKLLLRKKELRYMAKKVEEKGYTLVPLKLYFKAGWAKILIALAKGKTKSDKRDSIKKRIIDREIEREQKRDKSRYI